MYMIVASRDAKSCLAKERFFIFHFPLLRSNFYKEQQNSVNDGLLLLEKFALCIRCSKCMYCGINISLFSTQSSNLFQLEKLVIEQQYSPV